MGTAPLPTTVDTVCGYCGVGCGLTLTVKEGSDRTVASAKGTASHPANRGRLCTKGNTTADMLNAAGRLTTALHRTDRDDEQVPVDVDAAITEVARRFVELRERHGDDAVAFYVSGQMSLEAQYLANKLCKGYFRTNLIESNSRLCMASAGTGYKQSLGADGPPGSYDDLDHADVFLVIGANMADCHPILFLRMMDRVKAGAKLIVVDPRRTATAAKADLYLPVRPGTDLALLNGLLRLIVDAGHTDEEFIAEFTDGWDALPEHLADYPADRVAEITGIAEADLRQAAEWIGTAGNWVSLWTMGLNQSTHGTWHTNALCNLHLATGAICRTGSGPFSLTGQPNAMGGREMGYMGPGLPGQRAVLDPAQRTEVEERWGVAPGTLHTNLGRGTVDLFEELGEGKIKALWVICTNPVASMANRDKVIKALTNAEFVVVQDAFADVETASYADVVLPAALWSESEGVMINSERNLTLTTPLLHAPGQALPDWQIICRIAQEMGFDEGFDFPDASAVFDEITGFHNPRTGWDLRGVDYSRLRSGPVQWPAAPGGPDRNPIRYLNDGVSQELFVDEDGNTPRLAFATPSRRAQFFARPYLPPAEMPDDDFPLTLTTGRLPHQWHTMTKTRKVAKLMKLNPSTFVEVHPVDAQRLGIADGDRVEIRSRRGVAYAPAVVTEKITAGTCFVPMHFADATGADLAINAVTNDAVDPDSLQPEFKACAVALAPAPLPAAAASGEPLTDTTALLASAFGSQVADEPVTLTVAERAYLTGLLAGLRTSPPDGQVPAVPAHAPLSDTSRAWIDGVLAGIFSRVPVPEGPSAATPPVGAEAAPGPAQRTVSVVWASQTGTVEEYIPTLTAALGEAGLAVRESSADQVSIDALTGDVLFVVASTGDGDAPDSGVALWDSLASVESDDELSDLRYSVLGFGDSSYADFCGFARKLDARLHDLGATRVVDRASCEPDYEDHAAAWQRRVLEALAGADEAVAGDDGPEAESSTAGAALPAAAVPTTFSRKHPLSTELVENTRLTGPESDKDVRRFAFALPEGTLTYSAGDALGVWPTNRPAVVEEWLARTGLDAEQAVTVKGETRPLVDALTDHFDITRITPDLLRWLHRHHPDEGFAELAAHPADLRAWSWGRQAVDLLAEHPVNAPFDDWLAVLKPLTPRLYSISSSPLADPTRVEITVSAVRFTPTTPDGPAATQRHGVCSTYLADAEPGSPMRIFVAPNAKFGPPDDGGAPMIMVGPGTGVAPFRGFLHDRERTGATGQNWLFFGERHEATDYLYRDELAKMRSTGVLTKLDLAFSRDQEEKVYVQDRMRANAEELWSWIHRGAHVYVCGDADQMARDVDDALREIVAEQGRMSPHMADSYVAALAAEHRYVRDVY
ncbi:putative nitrate/sulfite reductase [Gordonia araii NBRC 100433]|uniref:assimilatory sulfite reductase (NADPH) n=1 Tax=Gordonia araii NBRC 100433 TaxID=1073574 RepID=G7H126_9ACTN|nr:bifunctional nitrate reductase/sulfite reductase flavoprotein subunit alpha [Gordonia araii]NNG96727.1 molybdopterin-dependent oxidoreductase [Gordonia araii NBRC 100433]GAB09587.1 putative nitrate/sulfite reductase [Gordonia araii NBRC 100433]